MKKLLKLIMAMGLTVMLLTACGGGEEKSTAKSVEPPKTEEKEPEEEPEEETPPVDQKKGMTEAEQALYDQAQPKLESILATYKELDRRMVSKGTNIEWVTNTSSQLQSIYSESEEIKAFAASNSAETSALGNIYVEFASAMQKTVDILRVAAEDDQWEWDKPLEWEKDFEKAVGYQREVEFYKNNGEEISVALNREVPQMAEKANIVSVEAGGSYVKISFEIEKHRIDKEMAKTCLKEMATIMEKLSQNRDYDNLEIEFYSTTIAEPDEEGKMVSQPLMGAIYSAETRLEIDYDTLDWESLPGKCEDYKGYI